MIHFCEGMKLDKIKIANFYQAILLADNHIAIAPEGKFHEDYSSILIDSIQRGNGNNDTLLGFVIKSLYGHVKHLKNGLTIDVHLEWVLESCTLNVTHVKHLCTVIKRNSK